MSYFGFIAGSKPICDRAMVASSFAGALMTALKNEPDYKQLIMTLKDRQKGPGMLELFYKGTTVDYDFGYEYGNWLKKSCKLSYDSGLFDMTTKGKMQFFYDVMQIF